MSNFSAFSEVFEPFDTFEAAAEHLISGFGVEDLEPKGVFVAGTRGAEGLDAELISGQEYESPISRVVVFTVNHGIGGQTFAIKYVAVFGPVPRLDDEDAVEDDGSTEGEVNG